MPEVACCPSRALPRMQACMKMTRTCVVWCLILKLFQFADGGEMLSLDFESTRKHDYYTSLQVRPCCSILSYLRGGGGITISRERKSDIDINELVGETVPCLFRVKVPHTQPGDTVKIVGGAHGIGDWKTHRAVTLKTSKTEFPW
jgi:hypothetical protein